MIVGMVGYGNIAQKHEKAINTIDDIVLAGVYDIKEQNSEEWDYYGDLNDILSKELDLISVCSPNGLHYTHVKAALMSGHHVICEKPFTLEEQQAMELIGIASSVQRDIFCVMQNRYSPVSQWLKKIVDEGQLGPLYLVNIACYWNRNNAYYKESSWRGSSDMDGGTLFTQFSHYVDTLYWLFGDMKITGASFANMAHQNNIDFEDTGSFTYTFNKGGIGTFTYTTANQGGNFESTLIIVGEKGTIKVAGQYMSEIIHCDIPGVNLESLQQSNNINNIAQIYRQAQKHIKSKSAQIATPQEGAAVVKIIQDVYNYKNGG